MADNEYLDRMGMRNMEHLVMLPKGTVMQSGEQVGTLEEISFTYFQYHLPIDPVSGQIELGYLPLEFDFQNLPSHVKAKELKRGYEYSMKNPFFNAVRNLEVALKTESGEIVKTSDLEHLSVDSNDSKGE